MLKFILSAFGGLAILSSGLNIALKLFGDDAALLRYYGTTSRNLDTATFIVAAGLVLISLSAIIHRLDNLLEVQEGE